MKILALDYGEKRVGIAQTDLNDSIAFPLKTVSTSQIFVFLEDYYNKYSIQIIVIGFPINNIRPEMSHKINTFAQKLQNIFKNTQIIFYDERFTSKIAQQTLVSIGSSTKQRQKKQGYIDKISVCLILQDYLKYKL